MKTLTTAGKLLNEIDNLLDEFKKSNDSNLLDTIKEKEFELYLLLVLPNTNNYN